MPQLGPVTLDIPKQIALANIALRVQHRSGPAADEYFLRCTNHWMAVGGVLVVDLLALPPGAKKVGGWEGLMRGVEKRPIVTYQPDARR